MGSMTKGSVLLLLLVSFVLIATAEEMVGAKGTREVVGVEEKPDAEEFMVENTCYVKMESFGICIVAQNCSNYCKRNKYPLGGKCKGVRRYCYCMKKCITMEKEVY